MIGEVRPELQRDVYAGAVVVIADAERLRAPPTGPGHELAHHGRVLLEPTPPLGQRYAGTPAEALHARGAYRQATEALDSARQTLPGRDDRLAGDLEAAYIASASYLPEFASQIPPLREELLSRSGERPTRVQRRALAQLARRAALSGDARQSVTELVNRMQPMSQAEVAGEIPLERAQRANGAQTCSVDDV